LGWAVVVSAEMTQWAALVITFAVAVVLLEGIIEALPR
jgi:hypothetical protein